MLHIYYDRAGINIFSKAPVGDSSKNFGRRILTNSRHFLNWYNFFLHFPDDHVHIQSSS